MRSVALFTALLLVLSGVGPAVAAPDSVSAASGTDGAAALSGSADGAVRAQTASSFDRSPETVMRVGLRENQNAEWHVEVRYRLDDENETRAFERIGRAYERGESDVGVDADLFRNIASQASETTGREMEIQNATYDYSVNEDTGTLSLTFVWTNFLERDGGNLRLGDVFLVPSDQSESTPTWLSLFGANQRMVIQPPEGYTANTTSIPVKQQGRAIVLDGPADFDDDNRLVVTYERTDIREQFQWPLYLGGGAVVLVALALGAAVVLRGRRDDGSGAPANAGDGSPPGGATAATNGGVVTGGAVAAGGDADGEPDDVVGPQNPENAGEEADADEDEVDVSLLSDEERVEYLLEQNGGRMKQANIVKETGWSDAKVSQLLSAMADDGRVTKLRLGRENLISLPDEDEPGDETA